MRIIGFLVVLGFTFAAHAGQEDVNTQAEYKIVSDHMVHVALPFESTKIVITERLMKVGCSQTDDVLSFTEFMGTNLVFTPSKKESASFAFCQSFVAEVRSGEFIYEGGSETIWEEDHIITKTPVVRVYGLDTKANLSIQVSDANQIEVLAEEETVLDSQNNIQ